MGIELFTKNLSALHAELSKESAESMAMYYFHSPARGLFFKLEALSRMYRKLHNKKLFNSLYEEFKLMEDALGKMDYYDSFLKEFSKDKNAPESLLTYFKNHLENESTNLELLIKSFPYHDSKYISQIETRLADADWIKDTTEERKQISIFLIDSIEKFEKDYKKGKLNFNTVEEGLHEFRRKLRWVSIYVASLDGLVQLKKTEEVPGDFKKYMTDEIINLPYNKLPEIKQGLIPIYIEAPNFYALSWLIQELGTLKDMGLKSHVVDEGVAEIKETENKKTLRTLLKQSIKYSPKEILKLSQQHADDFIYKDFVLERINKDLKSTMK